MEFIRRTITEKVESIIRSGIIALIVGPRQSGKTSLIKDFLKNHMDEYNTLYIDGDYHQHWNYLLDTDSLAAKISRSFKLGRRFLIAVDEIQKIPDGGNALKRIYDRTSPKAHFIVTGSSFLWGRRGIGDNLTGRASEIHLLPFSMREIFEHRTGISTGFGKFESEIWQGFKYEIQEIWENILQHGAFPSVYLSQDEEDKTNSLVALSSGFVRRDLLSLIERGDWTFFKELLQMLASEGTILSITSLASSLGRDRATVRKYLEVAEELFILKVVRNFGKNIRTEIRKQPKVLFVDVGLMRAIAEPFSPSAGILYEQAVGAEIWKAGIKIRHWRTKSGAEVDFVMGDKNIPVEVKKGYRGHNISRGFRSFINKYSPEFAFWLHNGEPRTEKIGNTILHIMPAPMFALGLQCGIFNIS